MNLLLEGKVLDASTYIWLGVIVVLFIAFYTLNLVRRRKYQDEVTNLLSNLQVGDKVKTYTGVFGTIVEIKEWANGNSVLLATGEGDKISYISVDLNAIYGIDNREKKSEEKTEEVESKETEKPEAKEETPVENAEVKEEVSAEKVENNSKEINEESTNVATEDTSNKKISAKVSKSKKANKKD